MAKDFSTIPTNTLHQYNGADVASTLQLYRWQKERLGPFRGTYRDLIAPAFWALGYVERWGLVISESNVRTYDKKLAEDIEIARASLTSCGVSSDFNVRSPDQKKELLFKKLGLKPVGKKTKIGNISTGDEVLEELQYLHPGVKEIPAIRDLAAAEIARSTYGLGYLKHIGFDGRVHPRYRIVRSGRLATRDPTIQNLTSPDDDDEEDPGKYARGIYVAPEGCVFLSLDYAMQELRIAAMLSGDVELAAALDSDDFHASSARLIFGIPEGGKPSKLQRRSGKETNFGIAFDQGAFTLAKKLTNLRVAEAREKKLTPPSKVEEKEAQGFIDRLLKKYHKFASWRRERVAEGESSGDAWARWGSWVFRRQVSAIGELGEGKSVEGRRGHARRICINHPIQCIANAFGLASLYRCTARIMDEELPAELVMSVHDSLGFYVKEEHWREVAGIMKAEMLGYETGCTKLKIDVEVGPDFGHLKKVEV